MTLAYVDASVLVRFVLRQKDQLAEWGRFKPTASTLIVIETMRAIERAQLDRDIDSEQAQDARARASELLEAFDLVEMDRTVVSRAAQPFGARVRALDAIHLATAVLMREREGLSVLATHDGRHFAPTARALGFTVLGTSREDQS